MPRGTPLTPEQIERASEVYEQTGNYSEAARILGVNESAARRALQRRREPKRAELHRRAAARGERLGRVIVIENLERLREQLNDPGVSPLMVGTYLRESRLALRVLALLNDSLDRRLTTRIERAKHREELAALRKKAGGGGSGQPMSPDDEDYLRLVQEKFGGPRQGMAHVTKKDDGGSEPGP